MSDLIQRLRMGTQVPEFYLRQEAADEIERLKELTENDGKEIGSYREGTGLRGENRALEADNERLLAALESIANNTCCEGCQEAKRVALAALEQDGE